MIQVSVWKPKRIGEDIIHKYIKVRLSKLLCEFERLNVILL